MRIHEEKAYKRSAAWRKEYFQAWIRQGGLGDAVRHESL